MFWASLLVFEWWPSSGLDEAFFWKFSNLFATDLFRLVLVTWESSASVTSSSSLTLEIIHLIHYPLQELSAVVCFLFGLTSYRRESLLGIMGQLLNNTLGLQGTVEVLLKLGTLNSSAATGCWVPECVNWWTYSLSLGLFFRKRCRVSVQSAADDHPGDSIFDQEGIDADLDIAPSVFVGDSCASSAGPVTVLSHQLFFFFFHSLLFGYLQIVVGAQNSPKHRLSCRKCLSYWDCHRKAQHLFETFPKLCISGRRYLASRSCCDMLYKRRVIVDRQVKIKTRFASMHPQHVVVPDWYSVVKCEWAHCQNRSDKHFGTAWIGI